MTTAHLVPRDIAELYEIHEWRDAVGVLSTACPEEWADIQTALRAFRLHRSEIMTAGGAQSTIVDRLERPLKGAGWVEKHFDTAIVVDGEQRDSPTHSVDCFKGRVALEVEWNNKDPFYDRDLNNFRLLFDLQVIDVGVIITGVRRFGDFQHAWPRAELWKFHNTHGQAPTPLAWRFRRGLPNFGIRDQPRALRRRFIGITVGVAVSDRALTNSEQRLRGAAANRLRSGQNSKPP